MKKKGLLFAVITSALMAIASFGTMAQEAAPTQQPGYGPGYGPGVGPGYGGGMHRQGPGMRGPQARMPHDPFAQLGLEESQRKAIDALMTNQREFQQQHMKIMQEHNAKLRELYQADKWDADAITKLYDQMYQERRAMMEQNIKTRNEIMDKLNKEQREKLKSMMPQRPPMQ